MKYLIIAIVLFAMVYAESEKSNDDNNHDWRQTTVVRRRFWHNEDKEDNDNNHNWRTTTVVRRRFWH